jgi:hypothetical protein
MLAPFCHTLEEYTMKQVRLSMALSGVRHREDKRSKRTPRKKKQLGMSMASVADTQS